MNKKNRWRYLDYLFITRPMLFFPGWNTLMAGYLSAAGAASGMGIFYPVVGYPAMAAAMLAFMTAMGGSFILNQLQDVESDRKNNKLFLVGNGFVNEDGARKESFFLIGFSLVLGFLIHWQVFLWCAVFITATGYFYNYPPVCGKDRPFWGLILNMLMGWLAFAIGWSSAAAINMNLLVHSLPYLFFNTALYLITTLPDREGDKAAGKRTLSVIWGG
ncbi:MAG: UbiA family prenyltransferase, partial [Calditrichia bacterium]